jgi:hypothetical protein
MTHGHEKSDSCGGRPVTGVPTATGARSSRSSVARLRGHSPRARSGSACSLDGSQL